MFRAGLTGFWVEGGLTDLTNGFLDFLGYYTNPWVASPSTIKISL